jgi:hypothetical protein
MIDLFTILNLAVRYMDGWMDGNRLKKEIL